jgi:hypothetical protein
MPSGPGVRTSSAQQHAALVAHGLGHDEAAAVAARRADHRQRDAGVAGGGFDDDGVGADLAGPFGRLDHRQADPVLDAVGRTVELELGEEVGARALAQAPDAHQRGITDQFSDVVRDAHLPLRG